tara:strand:- start:3304 stop:5541 length:2238 start_codon:yes stop_codon:yes gene_type:complete
MAMRYIIIPFILFQSYSFSERSISGNIIDKTNQLPLEGANISVVGTIKGVISDINGDFSISELKNGYYSISVSYMGYESKLIADIWVRDNAYEFLKIELNPTIIDYEGVMVTQNYFSKTNVDQYNSITFNNDEIRRAPGSGQEISRILNALPSVASVGENRQDMLVRGGGPTENGFVIDNIHIPSISHFNTPDGRSNGPIGMINTEMVDDIEFFSNGFPAEFGNKLSSYGDISYRDGKKDSLAGNVSIGMGGAGSLIEGSIVDDVTFIGSYRRSYLDLISDAINAGGGLPSYDDLQGKLKYSPSHYDAFTILLVNGNSLYDRKKEESISAGEDTYGNVKNKQNTIGLGHRHIWNQNAYSSTSISISKQNANAIFYENQSDTVSLSTNDIFRTLNARQINHIQFNKTLSSVFGFEIQNRNLEYDFLLNNVNSKNDVLVTNLSSFITIKSILVKKALISIGSRIDWNDFERDILIAPRINVDFSLSKGWGNLIINSGKYFQNPPEKYLSVVEKNDLRSINTIQHSLTFEKLITSSTKFSISVYEKQYDNAPMMERNQIFTDPTFLLDQLRTYRNIVSNGKAKTSGVEVLIEKKRATNFYGLIGGSIYKSIYHDQLDVKRNRNNNYEYLFNIVGGYRPNSKWEISLRWSLFGGRPYTKIDLENSNLNNEEVLVYNEFNQSRTPIYHNLFLRYERRKKMKYGNIITYIELWNAYNRKNIETYFWSREKQDILETAYFSFIPVGGVEIEF